MSWKIIQTAYFLLANKSKIIFSFKYIGFWIGFLVLLMKLIFPTNRYVDMRNMTEDQKFEALTGIPADTYKYIEKELLNKQNNIELNNNEKTK